MAFEQIRLAVEHADAARPIDLVAGEDEEIATQRLDVDGPVRRGLGAVDHHMGAMFLGDADDIGERRDGAQRIGGVRHRDEPGARREQLRIFLQQEFAGVIDRRHLQHDALAVAEQLPGHDVGMMLQGGDDDFIAGLEESARHS